LERGVFYTITDSMQPLFASFFTFIGFLIALTKAPVLTPTYTYLIHRVAHIKTFNRL